MSKTFYFNPNESKADNLPPTVLETRRRSSRKVVDTPVKDYPIVTKGNEVKDLPEDNTPNSHLSAGEELENRKATKQQIIEDAQKAIDKLGAPEENEIEGEASITEENETNDDSPVNNYEMSETKDCKSNEFKDGKESLLQQENESYFNQKEENSSMQAKGEAEEGQTMESPKPAKKVGQGSISKTSKSETVNNDRLLLLAVLIIVLKSPKRDWSLIIILLTLLMTD